MSLDSVEKLKASVWLAVQKICAEQARDLSVEIDAGFVACLSELVYHQAVTMGQDLESFTKHAKRSIVSIDDIKLYVRRNRDLQQTVNDLSASIGKPDTKRTKA